MIDNWLIVFIVAVTGSLVSVLLGHLQYNLLVKKEKINMVVEEYEVVDDVYEVYYNVVDGNIDIAAVVVGNLSLDEDDIGHEQWGRIEQHLYTKHNINNTVK